jgi:heat-inducible transcriptional repressor
MSTLTKRQEYLLGLIVREYVSSPTPVSSKLLVERYGLQFSTATVRNDMAALEEESLVYAPHTSAGRVPTEAGYRYFVQKLLGDTELSSTERRRISHQFYQSETMNMEQWLRLAASVLAQTARSAALVTSPIINQARFKHMELISTQGRLVLLILVLEGGDVRQQMLTLSEPVSQEMLSQAATRINEMCVGLLAHDVRTRAAVQPALEADVLTLVAELLERADKRHRGTYYDGLVNILDPAHLFDQLDASDLQQRNELTRALEEVDQPGARQALRLLEEQSLLEEVLAEALAPDERGVQVIVGGEGRWEELSHISIIVSRYGVEGMAMGTLGVLGPTRLHYGRAVSAVQYVSGLMSELLIDIYGEGEPSE